MAEIALGSDLGLGGKLEPLLPGGLPPAQSSSRWASAFLGGPTEKANRIRPNVAMDGARWSGVGLLRFPSFFLRALVRKGDGRILRGCPSPLGCLPVALWL